MVHFNGTQESFKSLLSQTKFEVIRNFWIQEGDRKITEANVSALIKRIRFFWESLKAWRERGVPEDQVSDYLSSKATLRRVVEPCKEYLDIHPDLPNRDFGALSCIEVKQTLDFLNEDDSTEARPKIQYHPLPRSYKLDAHGGLVINHLCFIRI